MLTKSEIEEARTRGAERRRAREELGSEMLRLQLQAADKTLTAFLLNKIEQFAESNQAAYVRLQVEHNPTYTECDDINTIPADIFRRTLLSYESAGIGFYEVRFLRHNSFWIYWRQDANEAALEEARTEVSEEQGTLI